ncbi:glycosyltransferase family 2 protein [Frondihabitans peucedani]|uniref:GT2 family glycosyltransferase n=1 Tax=Frondihabitans peucedani TaxID=598626 RepID=A0ABP8E0D2_9MICO
MSSLDDVSIVVVNYGSSDLLEVNLATLTRVVPGVHAVVVDNLTDDAERRRVTALAEREGWSVVLPDGNEGFGGGMNLGVRRAQELGAAHHVLVNPDAVLDGAGLEALVSFSRAHPGTMASPRILRPDGSIWFDGSDLYLDDGRIRSRRRRTGSAERVEEWLSGACLVVSSDLWDRSGGFDEDYFLYWEDVDLSRRVMQAGGELRVLAEVTAVHAEGGTQAGGGHVVSGEAKSKTYYFHNIRNRLLFASKHLPTDDLESWRRSSARVAWEILLQGGRRQFVTSPQTLLVGLRAHRAGVRIADAELARRRAAVEAGPRP